jgi:hypothetical protein
MLDRKSAIYSDRPVFWMGGELSGWKNTLVLTPYGARFRAIRRLLHQFVGTRATMEEHADVEEEETHRLVLRILQDPRPQNLAEHVRKYVASVVLCADGSICIRRTAGGIILKLAYGYDTRENNDPFVERADSAVEQFSKSTEPGAFVVDIIPWCKCIHVRISKIGFSKLFS